MNASPSTTRMKPATCVRAVAERTEPTAAAPAPSTTKTTVKPTMNGMLDITTRRVVPRWPRWPASTFDSAAR